MLNYMECPCSEKNNKDSTRVTIEVCVISRCDFFTYLCSIIDMNGGLEEDVIQRIKAG